MSVTFVPEEGKRVPTIQDLKNLQVTNNRVVNVDGYNSSGDGGGGTFVWKDNLDQNQADGGIFFESTRENRGLWKRVIQSERKVNVKWYGAVGDGETDDSTPLERVWTHINNKGGGVLIFPDGNYLVKNELEFTGSNGLVIDGFGYNNSNIISQNLDNGLKFDGGTGIEIRNLTVEGETGNQGILSSFRFENCSKVILSNCFAKNSGANFNFSDCENVTLNNCEVGEVIMRSQSTSIPQGNGVIADNTSVRVQNLTSTTNIPDADVTDVSNGGEVIQIDRKLFVDTSGPTGGEDGDIFFVLES